VELTWLWPEVDPTQPAITIVAATRMTRMIRQISREPDVWLFFIISPEKFWNVAPSFGRNRGFAGFFPG
jgi:hypothetical protein